MKALSCTIISLLLVGCASSRSTTLVSGNRGAFLPFEEIPRLQAKAKAGDIDSALTLARYYLFWTYELEAGEHWTKVAAELGSPVAEYNLGTMLWHEHVDEQSHRESIVWLKRAAAQGYSMAADLLMRIAEKDPSSVTSQ